MTCLKQGLPDKARSSFFFLKKAIVKPLPGYWLLLLVGVGLLHPGQGRAEFHPQAISTSFSLDTAVVIIDSDGDGLPDAWENANGLNPALADANGNPDGDFANNLEEFNAGTDPQIAEPDRNPQGLSAAFAFDARDLAEDSDGDRLPDAWERLHGLAVAVANANADTDGDGMTNLEEYNGGWDPRVADIPALSSGQTVVSLTDTGAYPLGFSADSDGDGMPDWWEAKYGLAIFANDAQANPDGDDLTNIEEYHAGRIPNRDDQSGEVELPSALFLADTIGLPQDSDGDRMPDFWEIANGLNHLVANAQADPDNDGRSNLEEYNAGTDPQVAEIKENTLGASRNFLADTGAFAGGVSLDSDNDGMPDWWEIKYGLAPFIANGSGNLDGDSRTNLEEFMNGSNPRVADFLVAVDAEGNLFLLDTGGQFRDTDRDGLPDWWERKYTGNTLVLQPEADLDGDGQDNLMEYLAGFSPTDGKAKFVISESKLAQGPGGRQLIIKWLGQPGRHYQVFVSPDFVAPWPAIPVHEVDGSGILLEYAIPMDGERHQFTRIRVSVIDR